MVVQFFMYDLKWFYYLLVSYFAGINIDDLRLFWKYFLRWNDWVIEGIYPYSLPKLVIAVAPHTSSRDFIIGLAVRSVLRLYHIRYLGKAELFRPPFGFIFKMLGGTPVDRSAQKNLVEQVVDRFNTAEKFTLALSPEGTRKRVVRLKTGFYHIALKTGSPILPISFDFAERKIRLAPPFHPTGNMEADFRELLKFWAPCRGYHRKGDLFHLMPEE